MRVYIKDGRRVADVSLPMPVAGAGDCRLEYRALLDEVGPDGLIVWPTPEEEASGEEFGGAFMSMGEVRQHSTGGASSSRASDRDGGPQEMLDVVKEKGRSVYKSLQSAASFAGWAGSVGARLAWRLSQVAAATATGSLTPKDGVNLDGSAPPTHVPGYPAVPVWVGSAVEAMPEMVVHVQSCDVVMPGGNRVDVTQWASGEYVGHELLADAWEDVDSGLGREAQRGEGAPNGADGAGGGHPFEGLSGEMREARDQTLALLQDRHRERLLLYRAAGGAWQPRDQEEARAAIERAQGRGSRGQSKGKRQGRGAGAGAGARVGASQRATGAAGAGANADRVVDADFREVPSQQGSGRQ